MGSDFDVQNVTSQQLLDDEELGVFLTNIEIMCLDRVKEHTEEIAYYEEQLNEESKADRLKFKQHMAKHEFWTIHKQADKWFNLFNPVRMDDLYANIFG